MIYLGLAILASSVLAIVLKYSEKKTDNTYGICLFNYLTCSLAAFLFIKEKNIFTTDVSVLLFGSVSGILYLGSLVLYGVNIRKNGTVLAAVFSRLGILIPTAMSFLFFGEIPTILQIIGIIIAAAAIIVINYQKGAAAGFKAMGLVLLLIIGGLCDSTAKIFEFFGDRKNDDKFIFFTFLFAMVFTLIPIIKNKRLPGKYDLIFGVMVGIPNYFVTRFLLKALTQMPAFIVYPTYSVGAVIVISIASRLLFGDKLNRRQLAGVGMILISLLLLNL